MLQPGDRIGRYEIQRRLGRGGMGTVYVAHDPNLGRLVALKMFEGDFDAADAADKFAREARAAAALNHTHIVTVHELGEFSSQPFIVMEYIQGDTLAKLIRTKAELTLPERLRLIHELCLGVAYAHGFDVIHRDIKPANLMVDRSKRLKILDFGIARMLGSSMSRATALVGTPGYMAPEQIRGGTIDRRSDLFSIGVVSYELLSYAEAFSGESFEAITHQILTKEPVPLTRLVPEIPEELVAIVEKALKKDAADRFADAQSFGAAIAQVRRQVEADDRFATSVPTLPGGSSQRNPKSSHDSRPEPGRVGREEILRRRVAQIDASLARARVLLQAGDLEDALEACVQALTVDDTHAGALDVERAITAAMATRRAGALVDEAREELGRGALTVAQGLLVQARALDADAIDVRKLDLDLRLARVDQEHARQRADGVTRALAGARAALGRGELETALASARQALQLDPASDEARQLEVEVIRRLDVETGAAGASAVPSTIISTRIGTVAGQSDASGEVIAPTVVVPNVRRQAAPPLPPAPLPVRTPAPLPPIAAVAGPAPAPTTAVGPNAATPSAVSREVAPRPATPRRVGPSPFALAFTRARAVTAEYLSRAGHVVSALATVTVPRLFRQVAARLTEACSALVSGVGGLTRGRARVPSQGARPVSGATPAQSPQPAQGTKLSPGQGHAAGANRRWIQWTAGGAVFVGAIAASAFLLRPPPAPPPVKVGTVSIDAVPWATVTAIVSEDGTPQPIPAEASTPMSLDLPVGSYRITLAGPPPESASKEVSVTVEDGKAGRVSEVRFTSLTAEDYFKPYLAPSPEEAPSDTQGAASPLVPAGLPSEVPR